MDILGVVRRNGDAKLDPSWLWVDVVDGSWERAWRRAASTLAGILPFPDGRCEAAEAASFESSHFVQMSKSVVG
jgi:hypothetical protein